MDKKKLLIHYIEEVFMIFGIMIMLMNLLCLIFGESAKGISQMFVFGNKGLSLSIMIQFFCIMSCLLITIVSFIILFDWFPINMWEPWLLFGVSFGISFVVSCVLNVRKERVENEKMARALEKLKRSVDHEESS